MKKKGREKLFSPRPRKEKKKRRGCSFVVVVASVPLPFPSLLPIFRPRTNTHLCLARRRGNDAELANPRKQTMKQQKYNNAVYLHLRFRIFLKATFVGSHTLMTDGQCQPFFSSPPLDPSPQLTSEPTTVRSKLGHSSLPHQSRHHLPPLRIGPGPDSSLFPLSLTGGGGGRAIITFVLPRPFSFPPRPRADAARQIHPQKHFRIA